jgi:hypothetical protein
MNSDSNILEPENLVQPEKKPKGRPKGRTDTKPRYHIFTMELNEDEEPKWIDRGLFTSVKEVEERLGFSRHTIASYISGKIRTPFTIKIKKL